METALALPGAAAVEASLEANSHMGSSVKTKVLFCNKRIVCDKKMKHLSWDLSDVEQAVFPDNDEDFQKFLEQYAQKRQQIDTVFMAGTPSSKWHQWNLVKTVSLFVNLKSLSISVDLPIELLCEILRNAPNLETLEMVKYRKMGHSFSAWPMIQFCDFLGSHPSLRFIKFEPMVEVEYGGYDYMGFNYSGDKIPFDMDSALKAFAQTPKLQVLHIRPSLRDFRSSHLLLCVSVSSLAQLCCNPALLELAIDFRSSWGYDWGKERNLRLRGNNGDDKQLAKSIASSNMTKFSYRHSAVGSVTDEAIILDVVHGLKTNSRLESVYIEQRHTPQKPGLVAALADTLTANTTLTKLYLPGLKLGDNESLMIKPMTDALKASKTLKVLDLSHNGLDMPDYHELASVLKENDTLETLDLHGNNNASEGKNAFKAVFKSGPTESNWTLLHLKLEDCDLEDCDWDDSSEDDSRASHSKHYIGKFVPELDVSLLLNRSGRKKLFDATNTTYKMDLVEAISKVPTVCQGNREYYKSYSDEILWSDDVDDFPDLECLWNQRDELTKRDVVSWLEERDVIRVTYEFLRHNPGNWAPSSDVTSEPAVTQAIRGPPAKKMKRTHESL